MAWQTIGTTDLKKTTVTLGYVYLQYDDSNQGASRPVRLITGARSGYSFNVRFDNVTVDGDNQGTTSGVTGNGVVVWSGYVSGGRSISGSWSCPWDIGTKYYEISGYLPSGATSPSGGSITFVSSTYNSITSRSAVTNWGGQSGTLESIVVTGSANGDAASVTSSNWTTYGRINYRTTTSGMSATATISDSSYYAKVDSPISIKGLTHYKLAYWNWNAVGHTDGLDNTLRYLPPSKPSIAYIDPGTEGTKIYQVTFTGDIVNNHTTYDTAELNRTVRYKIDNGSWIVVENSVVKTIDAVSSFNVTVPPLSTATIEGYMTYHGQNSETVTVVITNSSNPKVRIYGSVNDVSKKLAPLYGTFGNYFDGRHYLERSNASVDILGDQITITKTSSGSGSWTYIFFLIDSTDELINKEVTLSGKFSTSGSFTSGPRLFWMKSNNVDWLSLVDGMEYQATGADKKFSITGTIPARPSGAGKLGLGLYANGSTSSPQGSYTIYNNVELKANVKNISNPTSVSASVTTNGITATYDATTQTFTFNGTCNKNNTCFTCSKLLNLEAGKYSLSFFVKGGSLSNITGTTKIQYQNSNGWANTILVPLGNTSASNSTTIPARPSNNNNVRFDNGVVANNYQIQIQLERGDATGSFAPFVDTKTHKILRLYASKNGRSKLIYDDAYQ